MHDDDILTERRAVPGVQKIDSGDRNLPTVAAPRPRVLVVEWNAFLRDCLVRSLNEHRFAEVIGFASAADVIAARSDGGPDIVLLSTVSLNRQEAEEALAEMRAAAPRFRIMVLANTDDPQAALAAIEAGASGYITTTVGFDSLPLALQFIGRGGVYIPPQCLVAAGRSSSPEAEQDSAGGLTRREEAVVNAIKQGKPNKVIAYELNMCESTVKVHVRRIMKKFHAKNRTDVAIKASDRNKACNPVGFATAHKTMLQLSVSKS